MDRQRLNRITALFLVIVVLVIALMLTGSLRRPAQVVLPEASDAPGGTGADPGGNSLTVVEVRPDTVQAAIATLARPEEYRRTVSVEQFWTGGSGTVETTATVSGAWTRTDRTLADGRVRHAVTDGETTYLWYNEAPPVLTLPAGSVTADAEQMIPTYETVLALPVERIALADYRTIGDQGSCIYVETDADPSGYVLRYWVSVDSGLLVAAEKLLGGETVYRMWQIAADLEPSVTAEDFMLPDGTLLIENKAGAH